MYICIFCILDLLLYANFNNVTCNILDEYWNYGVRLLNISRYCLVTKTDRYDIHLLFDRYGLLRSTSLWKIFAQPFSRKVSWTLTDTKRYFLVV